MATSAQGIRRETISRLPVIRVGLASAIAAFAFLLLCWIGALIGLGPVSHMYIQLFSGLAVTSGTALLVGLCYSLVGGFVAGALFAWIYNLLAPLDAR